MQITIVFCEKVKIVVIKIDSESKNWFVCRGCNSYDSISLTRCVIDKNLCIQLIKCVSCGHRRKEIWLSHRPLRKLERVEQILSESVKERNENLVSRYEQEYHDGAKIQLEL
ncbi:MAG: hypothetical protein WBX01_08235 [Nitrososphaeraceae archaeon]